MQRGVTWKIAEEPLEELWVVRLAEGPLSNISGAAIDRPLTDTLLWDVYLHRSRVVDPAAPWVDAATTSIPAQTSMLTTRLVRDTRLRVGRCGDAPLPSGGMVGGSDRKLKVNVPLQC